MAPRQLWNAVGGIVVILIILYIACHPPRLQDDSPTQDSVVLRSEDSAPIVTKDLAASPSENSAQLSTKVPAPRIEESAPIVTKGLSASPSENSAQLNTKVSAPIAKTTWTEKDLADLQTKNPDLKFIEFKPISITDEMPDSAVGRAFNSLSNQIQIKCPTWKMVGKVGDWPVCGAKALLPQQPCVIYSFGIKYEWSFDEAYHKQHGCLVRSFDPSMGGMPEHEHLPGIPFYPLGLSGKKEIHATKGWQMDNMKGFMTRFKDTDKIIPYIKFDIELSEWSVLENLLEDGILKNVKQLSFELHVDHSKNYRKYFKLMKGLESIGFRRWYGNRRYGGFIYQSDQSYININFLQ